MVEPSDTLAPPFLRLVIDGQTRRGIPFHELEHVIPMLPSFDKKKRRSKQVLWLHPDRIHISVNQTLLPRPCVVTCCLVLFFVLSCVSFINRPSPYQVLNRRFRLTFPAISIPIPISRTSTDDKTGEEWIKV